ncbi:MAG TPA: tRNA-dihydrouridine synthase [Actinomycetota bacterium]
MSDYESDAVDGLLGVHTVPSNGAAPEPEPPARAVPAPTIAVDLGDDLRLPTPVMVAAGCYGPELAHLTDVRTLGGIVSRSVTLHPHRGSGTPRWTETPSGLLSTTGLQNDGLDTFLERDLPPLVRTRAPVFVSVAGFSVEEYMQMAIALEAIADALAGIEVNACCPSKDRDGSWFADTPDGAAEVVGAVARLTHLPVFAKLSASVGDVAAVATGAVRAGARGVTLTHSLPALAVDPETWMPRLAAGEGGLSGPAIRPIALQAVRRVAAAMPETPVIGVGGITTPGDAVEFLLAGAWAVQVGTALFANPSAAGEAAAGVQRFLADAGLSSVGELRGRVGRPLPQPGPPAEAEPLSQAEG